MDAIDFFFISFVVVHGLVAGVCGLSGGFYGFGDGCGDKGGGCGKKEIKKEISKVSWKCQVKLGTF